MSVVELIVFVLVIFLLFWIGAAGARNLAGIVKWMKAADQELQGYRPQLEQLPKPLREYEQACRQAQVPIFQAGKGEAPELSPGASAWMDTAQEKEGAYYRRTRRLLCTVYRPRGEDWFTVEDYIRERIARVAPENRNES